MKTTIRKTSSTAEIFNANLAAGCALFETMRLLDEPLDVAATLVKGALLSGHKLLCCGNGGSATDSAHFSA